MRTSLLDQLLTVTSLFQRDIARVFVGTPLTEARVAVLWTIALQGPLTQQRLAEALSVTPRNVSALVDALETHEYVQRAPHPSDRRAVLVQLTPSGNRMMARMREDHEQLQQELNAAVAAADRAAFERGLEAVLARLAQLVEGEHRDYGEST